jgi:hypothetical protein
VQSQVWSRRGRDRNKSSLGRHCCCQLGICDRMIATAAAAIILSVSSDNIRGFMNDGFYYVFMTTTMAFIFLSFYLFILFFL